MQLQENSGVGQAQVLDSELGSNQGSILIS